MNSKTVPLLRSINRHLYQILELINEIEEHDYVEIIMKAQKMKQTRHICENARRGSTFLVTFFLLELLDEIADEFAD